MGLSVFTLKNIACTLDYKPQPMVIDKKGELISLFSDELPNYTIEALDKVKMENADKTWGIVVTPHQCGQVSSIFNDIESFTNQVSEYVKRLMPIINRDSFIRVGIRAFYELKISDAGEFRPLQSHADIPGIDDERLANLIHYQVAFEAQKRRIVITLGQNKRGNDIFFTPDIHGIDFHEITISSLRDTLKELYHSAYDKYKEFAIIRRQENAISSQ